ncbi:MAG: MotA/TolQ/ExbB proton channel family protein [Candidatus Omnitrophica bacterium]|nr:MotA/TolQ/ExbB proton channel family protein [Candidatus Omnitrophota bacterium]
MTSVWELNLWQLILTGGPIMIPILICSLFSLAIIIEKFYYYTAIKTDVLSLKKNIFDQIKNNKIKEAIKLCDENRSPIAKILRAGIAKFGADRDEIKQSIEDVSLYEIPKLENRLGALATIAHITPLLGLLGTVTGMTISFHTIQERAASLNPVTPGDLAGGIGSALLTTVAGLMIAIPTYVAYNFFVGKTNQITLEMERAATELINYLSHSSEMPHE